MSDESPESELEPEPGPASETELEPAAEPAAETAPTKTARRKWGRAAVVLVGVLVLGLIASNVVLWIRLDNTRTKLDQTRHGVAVFANDTNGKLDDASNRLDSVESDIGSYGGSGISDDLDSLRSDLDALTACVNDQAAGSC